MHKRYSDQVRSSFFFGYIKLLMQLQDWNNRRQFTPPSDFHADGVNEFFISQVVYYLSVF